MLTGLPLFPNSSCNYPPLLLGNWVTFNRICVALPQLPDPTVCFGKADRIQLWHNFPQAWISRVPESLLNSLLLNVPE